MNSVELLPFLQNCRVNEGTRRIKTQQAELERLAIEELEKLES